MKNVKTFKILHGKHSSGTHFKPHIWKDGIQKYVTFDKSAIYQFKTDDQYDINKLFGLSYGMHHTNSVRFGWRSLGDYSSKIEILAYCYVDGKRVDEDGTNLFIAMVNINREYRYQINVNDNNYLLSIHDDKNEMVGQKFISHNKLPFWGYTLYPYFGGNRTAPHNITIKLGN